MVKKSRRSTKPVNTGLSPFSPIYSVSQSDNKVISENISTELKNAGTTIQNTNNSYTQESGHFTGYAYRVTSDPKGNSTIVGIAKQVRSTLVCGGNTYQTFNFTPTTGYRYIILAMTITVFDADGSMAGTNIDLQQGTTTIKSFYISDNPKMIHIPLNPPPTFDLSFNVVTSAAFGSSIGVNDWYIIHFDGYEEEI